jgi:hypothetical protein
VPEHSPFSLLFDRPVGFIRKDLASIAHDDTIVITDSAAAPACETIPILFEGMSLLLRPNEVALPANTYRPIFHSQSVDRINSALGIEFGPNLVNGLRVPTLAAGYLQLVASLSRKLEACGILSHAAMTIADCHYFAESVDAYVGGGAFPVLATIALVEIEHGLETRGLVCFAGQEVRFQAGCLSSHELARRLVRIIHDIATNGPVMESQFIADLEGERWLHFDLSENGMLLNVTVHFGLDSDLV